jgi:phosphoribosylanthranilate isomerase
VKAKGKSAAAEAAAPHRVRIKICGLTRARDVRLALTLGADYLGFIFAPSLRQVVPVGVAAILRSLEKEQSEKRAPGSPAAERVGVFVDADRSFIDEAVHQAGLTMLQLHGDEDPEYCGQFGLPVIKALRIRDQIRDRGIFEQVHSYLTPYILLEPYVQGKHGGTGVQADWQLAAEIVRAFPDKRFFLAGGLRAENVQAAVAAVRPFAVDASSALESRPGIKDRQKMEAFIEAVRSR